MKRSLDSLDALDKLGAFTPAGLVEEEVEWQVEYVDEETGDMAREDYKATVHVRRLSFDSAVTDLVHRSDKTDNREAIARRIASSICNKAGEPVFTVGDITGQADPERGPLCYSLTMALLAAIGRVNSLGKAPSPPAKARKSGTNS